VVVMRVAMMSVVLVVTTSNLGELIFSQLFQNPLNIRRSLKHGEHGSLLSELRLYK